MDPGRFAVVGGKAPGLADGLGALVGLNPAVAVGLGIGALLLAGGIVWRFSRHRSPANRFARALAAVDEVTVLMHPNPDPDAMASALGVSVLARSVGTDSTVRYTGRIRHEENRAMRSVLGLEFEPLESVGELEDHVVLVDHNEPRGFAGAGGLTPYAVVDHHPGNGVGERFTDIRPEYGSCAAIVAEYLHERGWHTGDEDQGGTPLSGALATALLFGIRSDTSEFTRGCTESDFDAAAYVFPAADAEAMDRIVNPPVDESMLDTRARAVQYRKRVGSSVCSFVGEVENVDALGQAADELLRLEGVTAVVVAGEHDGTLHLSGRSRDDEVHMGNVLREVVADIPMADAGGHARMGGGQLSVEHMNGIGPGKGLTEDQLRSRVFDSLRAESSDGLSKRSYG